MIYTAKNTIEIGNPVNTFVNGNKIDNVFFADTGAGVVKFWPSPVRTMNGKRWEELYSRTLRGTVTVEPVE